jgi:DNA-binding transcriptional LysR family regulator
VNVPAARWLKAQAKPNSIAARCGNVPSAVLAVKAGAGLTALPAVHASMDQELVCVLGPLKQFDYPIHLYVHKDLRRVPRVSAFFEFCQRELKPVLLTGQLKP